MLEFLLYEQLNMYGIRTAAMWLHIVSRGENGELDGYGGYTSGLDLLL